eukprot:539094-Pelagomonas_calceolata.AAC.2
MDVRTCENLFFCVACVLARNARRALVNFELLCLKPQIETPLCKVVVMDQTGGDKARVLARALRQEGLMNAYVMKVRTV